MKILLLVLTVVVALGTHAQDQTIVVTPKSGNQQAVEELNRSLRDLGESFRERREMKLRQEQAARDYQLRKQQVETERRLAEEQIAASKAAREKAANPSEPSVDAIAAMAARAVTDAARTVTEPPAGRFQLITTTVSRDGRDQQVVLRMDTATGQTWELTHATNGAAFWQGVNAEHKRRYTAEEYESAAKTFEADGKRDLAELARQRAKELRATEVQKPNSNTATDKSVNDSPTPVQE